MDPVYNNSNHLFIIYVLTHSHKANYTHSTAQHIMHMQKYNEQTKSHRKEITKSRT
jgi:hypothetical protein